MQNRPPILRIALALSLAFSSAASLIATPANKAALEKHFDRFLPKQLQACTTCHLPTDVKNPEDLEEIPHNPFGARLFALGKEMTRAGKHKPIAERIQAVAQEDADGDGSNNLIELLAGFGPGNAASAPSKTEAAAASEKLSEFSTFLASYRWEPFQTVHRPPLPKATNPESVRNPIDAFVADARDKRGLTPRPEANKATLLRRVYIDLIGLTPTPEQLRAFEQDTAPDAYERIVRQLLDDPRYGERWGRHWMDVWRYSDWAGWSGGNQIRDSKPHIWRWRDWIVESLNEDKPYDRMLQEMLAADELAPADTNAVRGTGFLARNYKMLSREQWLEDTVKHTSQAFLGVTVGCAKCHNHMHDPIAQAEYYQMRAIFEPHQVRTDRVPGELDRGRNGLVRVYDVETNVITYFFKRGDERLPDTNRVMAPGVPKALSPGSLAEAFVVQPVILPESVAQPDRRPFVLADLIRASETTLATAQRDLEAAKPQAAENTDKVIEKELQLAIAQFKHNTLLATLQIEELEEANLKESPDWKRLAEQIVAEQRQTTLSEAKLALHEAKVKQTRAAAKFEKEKKESVEKEAKEAADKVKEAEKALAAAETEIAKPLTSDYKPRAREIFPAKSTGRRLAFAQWVTDRRNPLTARVAVNHIWLRHFGRGIVDTPADFGANGARPTHPELLDWLAAEFMAKNWSMKELHRLIVTSATYRMASTPDNANLAADPDNIYLWRMPSRRMEAEVVRDNLLHVTGALDGAMGGPDISHEEGLKSRRRSVYLRIAAEKEVEFLKLFDGPSVTECYRRHSTVMPQQALAMANSDIALKRARALAGKLSPSHSNNEFVSAAYERILSRRPTADEARLCVEFLEKRGDNSPRARENLILTLLNHNDFVTVR